MGLGIHSLVYGFVFFYHTNLADWAGLGPTLCCLAVPHSWATGSGPQLLPLGLISGRKNHGTEPTSSMSLGDTFDKGLLGPLCILLRSPSRHESPAKARSLINQTDFSFAVIISVALDGKVENLRPPLTLSSLAMRGKWDS